MVVPGSPFTSNGKRHNRHQADCNAPDDHQQQECGDERSGTGRDTGDAKPRAFWSQGSAAKIADLTEEGQLYADAGVCSPRSAALWTKERAMSFSRFRSRALAFWE